MFLAVIFIFGPQAAPVHFSESGFSLFAEIFAIWRQGAITFRQKGSPCTDYALETIAVYSLRLPRAKQQLSMPRSPSSVPARTGAMRGNIRPELIATLVGITALS